MCLSALLLVAARPCSAQELRIALADPDPQIGASLSDALAPWSATVVVVTPGVGPGSDMPGAASRGRAIAIEAGAAAAIWISSAGDGWTLWVYDVGLDRVMARSLGSGPPFDEPTASSIALTIVAFLRHGAAAPAAERVREPTEEEHEPPPSDSMPPPIDVSVEAGVGASFLSTRPADAEPRFLVAAHYVPPALGGVLALGLVARAGTGLAVITERLEGRFHDLQLLARVAARITLAPPVLFGVGVDLGARVTVMSGRALAQDVEVVRAVGIALPWLAFGITVADVAVWLRGGVGLTPWPQAYLVAGQEALRTEPVWGLGELSVEIGFR